MYDDLELVITFMEVMHPDNTFIINKLKRIYEEINANAVQPSGLTTGLQYRA